MKFPLKKHIFFLLLFHISLFSSGQEDVDSLKKLLLKADKQEQLFILNELSEAYLKISSEKSSEYAIDALLKNKRLQQEKIVRKKTIRNSLFLGAIFILLFVGLIYNYKNKIKANKILSEQNNLIQKKNEEIKNQVNSLSKINAELEKLSIVASKTDNAILITDADGRIEWINEGSRRLFGYTFEEFIEEKGKTLERVSSNPNIKEIIDLAKKEKKSQLYQSAVIAKSGRKYITQTTLTPIIGKNNEIKNFIILDSDITKLKNSEEELQKLLITKDKFFTIIAHDLKNPFNTLIGLTQLLVQGFDRMSTEKVNHFHKSLHQISKNGYELLINLLEWSRSQTGRMEFSPLQQNLFKLTEETFLLYSSKANAKEITLTNSVPNDLLAYVDLNMIKTIFRNIVANALKFTDRGGAIEISTQTNDSLIEVTIRDTGVGIAPEVINKLFELDSKHSTPGTDNETGTGLGLILCKEFVEKHKGRIWIESKVGFGSKFIFTLPVNNPIA